MNAGVTSLITLAKLTRIAIGVYIVAIIAYAGFTGVIAYFASALIGNVISPDSVNVMMVVGVISGIITLVNFIAFPASVILFALWVHRAWSNLHEGGVEGLNFTPGWATASFFIPFVNMVVPMQALRELHNRSHGESDWHAASSVGDVTSWYACTWAAFGIGVVLLGYIAVNSIPGFYVLLPVLGWIGLLALLVMFLIASAWFLYRVVGSVTAAQAGMLHYAQGEVFS